VDASFALSTRLHFLTHAMAGHAYMANSIYLRHPDVKVVIEPARPKLAAAVLWNKKYHAVARAHVQPLRPIWYVHHPVGRLRAKAVAYTVPPFYAKIKLGYEPPEVRTRVKVAVYHPPVIKVKAKVKKKVWIAAPQVNWYAGVKARVRPAPAKVAWYVKPEAPKARAVFGARVSADVKVKPIFVALPPRPRAQATVRFGGGVKVGDHRGHARGAAGAGVKVGGGAAIKLRDHRAKVAAPVGGAIDLKAGVGGAVGGAGVKVRDHRAGAAGAAADMKGGIKAGVGAVKVRDHRAGAGGAVDVKAGAGAAVKVRDHRAKTPERPKPPAKPKAAGDAKAKGEVKGSVKVKGGIKIGD
jgi:hypothetical protein